TATSSNLGICASPREAEGALLTQPCQRHGLSQRSCCMLSPLFRWLNVRFSVPFRQMCLTMDSYVNIHCQTHLPKGYSQFIRPGKARVLLAPVVPREDEVRMIDKVGRLAEVEQREEWAAFAIGFEPDDL